MKLFDDFSSRKKDKAGYSEPKFTYLNRSGRAGFSYLRKIIQGWFDEYIVPEEKREDLRRDFCSEDDPTHLSAFFELYLYRLFSQLGYQIEVEPEMLNGTNPDFLLTDLHGRKILLEATGSYPEYEFGGKRKMEKKIIDLLNEKINDSDFLISITTNTPPPNQQPSARKIANRINNKIEDLDFEEVKRELAASSSNKFKLNIFIKGDWIEFYLIPKNRPQQHTNSDPISMVNEYDSDSSLEKFDTVGSIKSSLERKRFERYVDFSNDVPSEHDATIYIIALNINKSSYYRSSIQDALFGMTVPGNVIYTDGFWRTRSDWQNERVSGVLTFNSLEPNKIGQIYDSIMWHNPKAKNPIDSDLFPFSRQIVNDSGYLKFIEGQSPVDLFEFDAEKLNSMLETLK